MFLHENDFDVLLIGRHRRDSVDMDSRPYQYRRLNVFFEKGPLFYAFYNTILFFYLMIQRKDVLVSNDLDTLLPNFIISKLFRKKLVYDSHELFTEVPELVSRPKVQNIWLNIEKAIFPKLKNVITVNQSIADIYHDKYQVEMNVVRNISQKRTIVKSKTRIDLGIPDGKFIVLMQGAWINVDRGGEELLEAFRNLGDQFYLVYAGGGDVIELLKEKTKEYKLGDKVKFFPKMPFSELCQITQNCDLGISLDKNTNLNYRYSLPNKVFDYIHSGIPILCSDLIEIKRVVSDYNVGVVVKDVNSDLIADAIMHTASNTGEYQNMKLNTIKASEELNWENETEVLKKVYL
jgi:glycosyltransferase involved in cell wall biosynthesis